MAKKVSAGAKTAKKGLQVTDLPAKPVRGAEAGMVKGGAATPKKTTKR